VSSTTFLFITLCTYIQHFGVTRVQTEKQENDFGRPTSHRAMPRRRPRWVHRAALCCRPAPLGAVLRPRLRLPRPRTSRGSTHTEAPRNPRCTHCPRRSPRRVHAGLCLFPPRWPTPYGSCPPWFPLSLLAPSRRHCTYLTPMSPFPSRAVQSSKPRCH
jgi:hypothetical protein